jgi:predicted acetyltransferase
VSAPEADERLEGYVFLAQRRKPDTGRHDVAVSDLVFTSARAGRRLLGFLSDLATIGDDAIVHSGPLHPICSLMPQQYYTSRFVDVWMVRINLVKAALEHRGYGRGVEAALSLEISDEVVGENSGGWSLRVSGGRGVVERGASGPALRCDVRGLAAVYAGFYSATQAAALGMVGGDTEALAAADAIFAGPSPWMADRF